MQQMAARRTRLRHSRHLVAHADHLWNSSHIALSSARFSSTQRRARLKTPLRRVARKQIAVRDANLRGEVGAFDMDVWRNSSWKNIRSLKPPNRLISGMRCPASARYRAKFALAQGALAAASPEGFVPRWRLADAGDAGDRRGAGAD
jgi:hypothetical protein